jgi:murein DD-endopeptidase MepM/ murein hydrolase activator NlpD
VTPDVAAIVERARLAGGSSSTGEASAADREKLKRVAAEFESMLLVQVLKDMRRAGAWEEEGSSDSLGLDSLFETLDVELASHLARVKGLGLSPQLEAAFDRLQPKETPNSQPPTPKETKAPLPAPKDLGELGVGSWQLGVDRANPGADSRQNAHPVVSAVRAIGEVTAAVPRAIAEATVAAPRAVGHLVRPVAGAVTSAFGWRTHPVTGQMKFHQGVDLRAAYGQEVQSAGAGKVVFSGDQGGYGATVVVEHQDGTRTRYAHLSARLVEKGDQVGAGELVGRAGRSGRVTGTHLHFEVIAPDGRRIAPDQWIARNPAGNPPAVTVARSIQAPGQDAD